LGQDVGGLGAMRQRSTGAEASRGLSATAELLVACATDAQLPGVELSAERLALQRSVAVDANALTSAAGTNECRGRSLWNMSDLLINGTIQHALNKKLSRR